jgi:ATP-dependent Clp protease ATP-binding subunit ClpA
MRRSSWARVSPLAIASVLLAGCGVDPAGQDLCARFADVQAAVEDLEAAPALDTANADAVQQQVDALRLQADKVRDTLDQVQRVSEGRLDTAIANARLSLDELRESLIVARYDAAETLGPKITEAQANLKEAYAPVASALDTQCPS